MSPGQTIGNWRRKKRRPVEDEEMADRWGDAGILWAAQDTNRVSLLDIEICLAN
jgi:hypothetical protein